MVSSECNIPVLLELLTITSLPILLHASRIQSLGAKYRIFSAVLIIRRGCSLESQRGKKSIFLPISGCRNEGRKAIKFLTFQQSRRQLFMNYQRTKIFIRSKTTDTIRNCYPQRGWYMSLPTCTLEEVSTLGAVISLGNAALVEQCRHHGFGDQCPSVHQPLGEHAGGAHF